MTYSLTTVKNIISSPTNFANFFLNILSPNKENQRILSDVVINKKENSEPTIFSQAMVDVPQFHDAINNKLKLIFPMLVSYLKQYNINNWLEVLIKTFHEDDKLNIDFIDFSNRIKSLVTNHNFIAALNLIKNSNTDTINKNWYQILKLLGVENKTFSADTPLGIIFNFLTTYQPTISSILTNLTKAIDSYIKDDILVPAEKKIDFNNTNKLWTTKVESCVYDTKTLQSTISYTLTQGSTTYNITVIIDGDASKQITNKNQIWIKDISLKS